MKRYIKIFLVTISVFLLTSCTNIFPKWILGTTKPTNEIKAIKGSLYLDTTTYKLYKKSSDSWTIIGNITGNGSTNSSIYINEDGYAVIDGKQTNINLIGMKGETGNAGKDGKDGTAPTITKSKDGFLKINDIKTTLRVVDSQKTCEFVVDTDKDYEFSVGDEIKCGTEYFYVMEFDEEKTTLLSKYNLDVGYSYNNKTKKTTIINKSVVKQSSEAIGYKEGQNISYGTIDFSDSTYWMNSSNGLDLLYFADDFVSMNIYDSNSKLFNYIEEYKLYLEKLNVETTNERIITIKDLMKLKCNIDEMSCRYSIEDWIWGTSYWVAYGEEDAITTVNSNGMIEETKYSNKTQYGIRPVVEIKTDNINTNKLIELEEGLFHCSYDGELVTGAKFTRGPYP